MLVYLKEKRGSTKIGKYRVYGKYYSYGSFGSTDLPPDLYKSHKNILLDAPYSREWLENKFNTNFDMYNFTVEDIKMMDNVTLVKLAKAMGVKFTGNYRGLTTKERNALKKAIIFALNN